MKKNIILQNQIKDILNKLAWSINNFSEKYYYHTAEYEEDNDKDKETLKRFQEKVRKHLQRKNTKLQTLENYLRFLDENGYITKVNMILPTSLADEYLEKDVIDELEIISSKLDEELS